MDRIWEAVSSPFYAASVIHIPGEIEDPYTLSRLSRLNGVLLYLTDNLFHEIRPDYTAQIQRELDQTEPGLLGAKLEQICRREIDRFRI